MKVSAVVTSISPPNKSLTLLADGCRDRGHDFIVIGDKASPKDFHLDGCAFYGLKVQKNCGLRFAELCPERSYSRKNIGYLLASTVSGSDVILETDDDNIPLEGFWEPPRRKHSATTVQYNGWINVYSLFTDRLIWPRGLPLDSIRLPDELPLFPYLEVDSPIQQGLADGDPDVDAIYRLVVPDAFWFETDTPCVALGPGSWCPFNSQATTWFRPAFPLMYLPSYCSFRLTDIYRSFVAQRIAWENNWRITFHAPTVYQDRNEHDLMKDFALEVPGYMYNRAMGEKLESLSLKQGEGFIRENMFLCYEELVRNNWIDSKEMPLLEAWFSDLGH